MTTVLAIVAAIVVVPLAAIWLGQRRLIYRPDPVRVSPASEGLVRVAEVILPMRNGAKIVSWQARAVAGLPTILYFHGNGGGLYDRSPRIRIMQAEGFGVLMMSYRGYSGSTGRPSETANVSDALAAYDYLSSQGVAPRDIVVFGESLGTGVAVQVAAQREVGGVILDSPFTSMVDVAAVHFPYVPVRLLLRDRYNSLAVIARVQAPLLFLHGEEDRVVPYALGVRLAEAADEPKSFYAFPGVGHLVPLDGQAWPLVRAFLREIAARRA